MSLSGEGANSNNSPKGEMPAPKNSSVGFEIHFVDKDLGEGLFATSKIEACTTRFSAETIDKVIFSCFPYCSDLISNYDKNLCSYCYKNVASVECTICHTVHYCSEACMNLDAYLSLLFFTVVTFIQNFAIFTVCLFDVLRI